eukprot:1666915-Rhodomonas_salina.1
MEAYEASNLDDSPSPTRNENLRPRRRRSSMQQDEALGGPHQSPDCDDDEELARRLQEHEHRQVQPTFSSPCSSFFLTLPTATPVSVLYFATSSSPCHTAPRPVFILTLVLPPLFLPPQAAAAAAARVAAASPLQETTPRRRELLGR